MTNDDEAAIDELNATVQGRAIVVNKSEPNQKEKEEVLPTVVETRWLWWWKQPWWRNRGGGNRILIFFFITKKKGTI
jgi:hypothetical protein